MAEDALSVGDRAQCRCAPGCSESWEVSGAIVLGPEGLLDAKSAPPHGPCIRGEILRIDVETDEALIRQDCGGVKVYEPIGYGQYAGRLRSVEVLAKYSTLVKCSTGGER